MESELNVPDTVSYEVLYVSLKERGAPLDSQKHKDYFYELEYDLIRLDEEVKNSLVDDDVVPFRSKRREQENEG